MKENSAEGQVYRLYALRPVQENIARAAAMRFQRMTPGYILVYAPKPPDGEAVEVESEEIHRQRQPGLSRRDQAWLYDCTALLVRERLEQRDQETRLRLNDLVAQLELALEEEAPESAKKGGKDA